MGKRKTKYPTKQRTGYADAEGNPSAKPYAQIRLERDALVVSLLDDGWVPSENSGQTLVLKPLFARLAREDKEAGREPRELTRRGPGVLLDGADAYATDYDTTWFKSPVEGVGVGDLWACANAKKMLWDDEEEKYRSITWSLERLLADPDRILGWLADQRFKREQADQ